MKNPVLQVSCYNDITAVTVRVRVCVWQVDDMEGNYCRVYPMYNDVAEKIRRNTGWSALIPEQPNSYFFAPGHFDEVKSQLESLLA